jgi:acetyl-CoA C-acetyltransferase
MALKDSDVVICSYARTPVGSFQGTLTPFSATELGAMACKQAVERAGIDPLAIDEVIMGNVLTSGLGQAPGRQAWIKAGFPWEVCAVTVNKVCGSGLKTVAMAAGMIRGDMGSVYLAGGQESMTNGPYALQKARSGFRMNDGKIEDLMVKDGLWDAYNGHHMGYNAELCAQKYEFSRERQDEFAVKSYKKAQQATADGKFKNEIFPVEIPQKKGDPIIFDADEEPDRLIESKVSKLKPAFRPDGTVTAVNASGINDGAAMFVVSSYAKAKEHGMTPICKIVGYGQGAESSEWFTIAPVKAIAKALENADLKATDIDHWEINEAFSVVTLAAIQEYKLDEEIVNTFGGSCAIGHPIGASGARILCTLISVLKDQGKSLGLATLCIGGGEGNAMIIEMV